MLAKEALALLRVSRPTLTKYVKTKRIKVIRLPNGHYDYDTQDVYRILNKDVNRKTCIYARVSTARQKKELENQLVRLEQFCFSKGYQIAGTYSDIANGINFERRKNFFKLLDEVIAGKVERVVVTYKDRLSRTGFDFFRYLFGKYHCELVVMSEVGSAELDGEETFEEILTLLCCYSPNLYSKRKAHKVRALLKEWKDEGA